MAIEKDIELCQILEEVVLRNKSGMPAKQIASAMCWPTHKLYELYDPESTRHIWVQDVIQLYLITRDDRLIQAIAGKCDGVYVFLQSDDDRVADLAVALKEVGEFCSETAKALKDNIITDDERKRISKEYKEAITALIAVGKRCGVEI